ncbi:MAG: hypothetical protein U1C57_00550 [Candidatus Doudnabacteria bacterium]|nr:hypothetical protein [bacterium]MDZ4243579.1 hypothetical protein [Candidatus Doudnabacteria bacterium]
MIVVSASDVHRDGQIRAVLKSRDGWPNLSYICDNCGESHQYLHQFSNQTECLGANGASREAAGRGVAAAR